MKTVKRILAVLLLIITLTAVGYFVYTGSRFSFKDEDYQGLIGSTFTSKDNEFTLSFIDEETLEYQTAQLEKKDLKDGVLLCVLGDTEYKFVIISAQTIYDVNNRQILRRFDYE